MVAVVSSMNRSFWHSAALLNLAELYFIFGICYLIWTHHFDHLEIYVSIYTVFKGSVYFIGQKKYTISKMNLVFVFFIVEIVGLLQPFQR